VSGFAAEDESGFNNGDDGEAFGPAQNAAGNTGFGNLPEIANDACTMLDRFLFGRISRGG
jgi:hypothetical protein